MSNGQPNPDAMYSLTVTRTLKNSISERSPYSVYHGERDSQTLSEKQLIVAAASGDRSAFQSIYKLHVNKIYSLCLRMTASTSAAEELTQDVFIRVWNKLPNFRGDAALSTWLHRVAVNIVLTYLQKQKQLNSKLDSETILNDAEFSKPAPAGTKIDLENAIQKLPPGARNVFVLHDIEGYKHEEIGELLGITAGGSKAQLHRARSILREALSK